MSAASCAALRNLGTLTPAQIGARMVLIAACTRDLHAALGTMPTAATPARADYFEYVPLLYTRLLQVELCAIAGYEGSRGARGASELFETIHRNVERAVSEVGELSSYADAGAARSAWQIEVIKKGLANYKLSRRSGRYDAASRGRHPKIPPGPSRPSSSLHMHFHLTNHGGTTLQQMLRYYTGSALTESCGNNA